MICFSQYSVLSWADTRLARPCYVFRSMPWWPPPPLLMSGQPPSEFQGRSLFQQRRYMRDDLKCGGYNLAAVSEIIKEILLFKATTLGILISFTNFFNFPPWNEFGWLWCMKSILSRASEVGSPINHLGAVLLRQGEPGTSQYILWCARLTLS